MMVRHCALMFACIRGYLGVHWGYIRHTPTLYLKRYPHMALSDVAIRSAKPKDKP